MSEKEVIIIQLAPAREWTIFDERRLDRLRSEARAGKKLFFVPHQEHPELSMFRLGVPYQIEILQHADICHAQIGEKIFAFNCHILLSHFSPLISPGDNYPFIGELSIAEIFACADRWLALGKLPLVEIERSEGYGENGNEVAPGYRFLTLSLSTSSAPEDNDPHTRALRLSKLTDMADMMRAIEVERLIDVEYDNNNPILP